MTSNVLQLSDVRFERIAPPTQWDYKTQKSVPLDAREVFLNRLQDKQSRHDWKRKTQTNTQSLFHLDDNLPAADAYHMNYLEYLEKCWANHCGIVFTPDILWYTLMGELVQIVQKDVEKYRHLFTESQEKQEIIVTTLGYIMPLSDLIESLQSYVPSDIDLFLPEFTTSNLRSKHAINAIFCDMVAPYYDYCIQLCGFPEIDVRGRLDDYQRVLDSWLKIKKLFASHDDYFTRVKDCLTSICENLNNSDYWKTMFSIERCGSGSDKVVDGWFTSLFKERPNLAKIANFSPHVAKVPYKKIDANPIQEFIMKDGLFYSHLKDGFLEPRFSSVVHEKFEPIATTTPFVWIQM